MKAIRALFQSPSDYVNPLVLKELRQAVQSRFVTVVLMLFLAVLLTIICLMVMLNEDIAEEMTAGSDAFVALQVALLATTLLFTAAYAGIRLAVETSQQNMDLLFITTIRPNSIIWGKLVAGVVLTLMIFSAAAPFMVLTYLLRGIDVATILYVLAIDLVAMLVVIQASMLVGAVPTGVVMKVILGLVLLGGIAMAFGFVMALSGQMAYRGMAFFTGGMPWATFWAVSGMIVLGILLGVGVLYFLTVVCVSPALSNRTTPARLYVTTAWLVTGAGMVGFAYTDWIAEPRIPLMIWALVWAAFFGLAMLFVASERDRPTRRQRAGMPRSWLLRPVAFLVYSGSAAGILWCALLAAGTLAITYATLESLATGPAAHAGLTPFDPEDRRLLYLILIAMPLYGYCYAMTASLVRQLTGRRLSTVLVGPIALALIALGAAVPALVTFFLNPYQLHVEYPAWLLPNPIAVAWFGPPGDAQASDYRQAGMWMLTIWAGAVTLLNAPWLIGQIRRFKPLSAEALAPADDTAEADAESASETETVTAHG